MVGLVCQYVKDQTRRSIKKEVQCVRASCCHTSTSALVPRTWCETCRSSCLLFQTSQNHCEPHVGFSPLRKALNLGGRVASFFSLEIFRQTRNQSTQRLNSCRPQAHTHTHTHPIYTKADFRHFHRTGCISFVFLCFLFLRYIAKHCSVFE